MPFVPLDPRIVPQVEVARTRVEDRLKGPEGANFQDSLVKSNSRLLELKRVDIAATEETGKAARLTTEWLRQIPEKLASTNGKHLIDLDGLPAKQVATHLMQGFDVLQSAMLGLILSDDTVAETDVSRIIQLAFGGDELSKSLRDVLVKPFEPPVDIPELPDFAGLADMLAAGNFRDRMKSLIDCGKLARTKLQFAAQSFGRIIKIEPASACPGDTVRITFDGLGANAPDAGWELQLSLPRNDGTYGSLRLLDVDPQLHSPGKWKNSGYLDVALPPDVGSGFVGFYLVPPPAGCNEQTYLSSSLLLANDIAANDPRGIDAAAPFLTFVLNIAEYMRSGATKLIPKEQADGKNRLTAGLPRIEYFRISGGNPIAPGRTITIEWKTSNASLVQLEITTLAGSEHPHEMHTVSIPSNTLEGRMDFDVPCTSNWNAACVLKASNSAHCGTAEVSRIVSSGLRHYSLGVAKKKFEFDVAGWDLRMLGFADEKQFCRGQLDDIFARAFVISELGGGAGKTVVVVMDLWSCSQPVKSAVEARIAQDPVLSAAGYSEANLMICGTHTHSAPGGFFHDYMYNLTLDGFNQSVFDHIVNTVVDTISLAHAAQKPGRLLFGQGTVPECGFNRSIEAFRANQEAPHSSPTDNTMVLLKFMHGRGMPSETERAVGCLNWFAMHPTSLGYRNDLISGDNKGWAASQFESAQCSGNGDKFVAGFANSACGDVSGNVYRQSGIAQRVVKNGIERAAFRPPLGKQSDGGLFIQDRDSMKFVGQQQCDAAISIFNGNGLQELSGKIDSRLRHVKISDVRNSAGTRLTFEGAMGTSFGAGSMEDGEANVYFGFVQIGSGIVEGVTRPDFDKAGVTAALKAGVFAGLVKLTTTVLGPLATPLVKLLLGGTALTGTLATMDDHEKSWFMTCMGYLALAAFRLAVHEFDGRNTGFKFKAALPAVLGLPEAFKQAHYPKPIIFACGLAQTDALFTAQRPCPLIPDIVPIQLLRIGKLLIAGIPGEITTVAGSRLRRTILSAFSTSGASVVLSTYANHYSGYITTREEYGMQHYEGASTLYGPATLEAYQQEYSKLADALFTGSVVAPGDPEVKPGVYMKAPN